MRILQVNKSHHHRGGANHYYLELSRALVETGNDVINFSMRDDQNDPSPFSSYFVDRVDFNDAGGTIERIKCSGRAVYSLQARKKIRLIIDRFRPNIAHIHNIYHQLSPSFLPILRDHGIPVVMTAHDYKLVCPNYMLFNGEVVCERCVEGEMYNILLEACRNTPLSRRLVLLAEAYLHRILGTYRNSLDVVIAPSMFMKDILDRNARLNARVINIPNFVDPIPAGPKFGGGEYILYFGRLSREKGLSTLIRAVKRFPDSLLLIAGEGPEKRSLEMLCDRENADNVRFIGQKNPTEIRQLIDRCAFSVLPSIWYENCPLSILESMARGKPVVGSRIGGIPELIGDGRTGLLSRAGDVDDLSEKIGRLLKDRDLRVELGRNGYRDVKIRYNKADHCRAILSVYEDLVYG